LQRAYGRTPQKKTIGIKVKAFDKPVVATPLPNLFVVYCRQMVLHGDITSGKEKAKTMHLCICYNIWAQISDKTLTTNKLDDFLMVADKAKKDSLLIQNYFLSSWDPDA
jgi:hypothetical protein